MPAKNTKKQGNAGADTGTYNTVLIIRLVTASLIFAASLIFNKLPEFVGIIMLVASAVISGFDIAREAIGYAADRDFFATPVVVCAVTVLSFIIGFPIEGAALLILYQIGMFLLSYVEERSRLSAIELLQYHDDATVNKVIELVCKDGASDELVSGMNSCAMCKRLIINAGISNVIIRDDMDNYRIVDTNDWIVNDESLEDNSGYSYIREK